MWEYPDDNSDSVSQYLIEIRSAVDLVSYFETAECLGDSAQIVSDRQCHIELQTLRQAPFNLAFDDFIVVRVKSMNSFGWSALSQPSLGQARVLTEPAKMVQPTYIALESNGEQMSLQLTALTSHAETGGSQVDSYKV